MDITSTSSLAAAHAHEIAHEHTAVHDPSAHAPQPSFWPIILATGMGLVVFCAFLIYIDAPMAGVAFAAGCILSLVAAMGWANTIAVERRRMDLTQTTNDLTRGFFMFLASEAMIFFSYFLYIYYSRIQGTEWPPAGMPRLETELPAIGTLILVGSSFTLNWAIHSFMHGKKQVAKNWMLLTIFMGITFLAIQGYDWGQLNNVMGFTVTTGAFSSAYFLTTGFHGAHVTVGLLMLALVYWRMEKDEYDTNYHMSMKAAEYYWHFVDVVWIILFFTLYLF